MSESEDVSDRRIEKEERETRRARDTEADKERGTRRDRGREMKRKRGRDRQSNRETERERRRYFYSKCNIL